MKLERPPTVWIAWTALVVMAIVVSMLLSGCATTEAYRGPDYSSPIVQLETRTHWNTSSEPRFPFWETHRMIRFENPLYKPVSFDVDCQNNYFHVDVPARTVSRLLITREDGACDVRRVPAP